MLVVSAVSDVALKIPQTIMDDSWNISEQERTPVMRWKVIAQTERNKSVHRRNKWHAAKCSRNIKRYLDDWESTEYIQTHTPGKALNDRFASITTTNALSFMQSLGDIKVRLKSQISEMYIPRLKGQIQRVQLPPTLTGHSWT